MSAELGSLKMYPFQYSCKLYGDAFSNTWTLDWLDGIEMFGEYASCYALVWLIGICKFVIGRLSHMETDLIQRWAFVSGRTTGRNGTPFIWSHD